MSERASAMRAVGVCLGLAGLTAIASGLYVAFGREPCLTWGATAEDADRVMPGDDLLTDPDIISTRAIWIDAPPSAVWPWLVQMGSGKGGVYTYDWIENIFGLNMHSADEILPQFQNRKVGDVEKLGSNGPRLRVEELEAERTMVVRSEDGNWIWAFCLYPDKEGRTKLVSRNRIVSPSASRIARAFQILVMEPGSLIMERKMLLGIKQRSEKLGSPEHSKDTQWGGIRVACGGRLTETDRGFRRIRDRPPATDARNEQACTSG